MLCDNCKKNEANVHVSRMVNGIKYEQNLCTECAGITPDMFDMFAGFNNMFGDVREMMMVGVPMREKGAYARRRGLEERDFESMGLKLPGSMGGTIAQEPKKQEDSLEELKQQLAAAVKEEYFEKAAELRDRIYVVEKKLKGEL